MTPASPIPPPRPLTDEVLTMPEIADLAGVTKAAVERWRLRTRLEVEKIDAELAGGSVSAERATQLQERRDRLVARDFPEQDDYIGSIPVWRLDRIVAWLELTQRTYDMPAWRAKREAGGFRKLHPGRPRS